MSWLADLKRQFASPSANDAPFGGRGEEEEGTSSSPAVGSFPRVLVEESVEGKQIEEGELERDPSAGFSCAELGRLIREACRPEWKLLPQPDSAEWRERFDSQLKALASTASDAEAGSEETSAEITQDASSSFAFHGLTKGEEFLLLSKVLNRLECPYAAARRRLRAVAEAEASRPLTANKIVQYAFRLAATTSAPPETVNTCDPLAHSALFPQYHFLPYPSTEEIQNSVLSRLAAKPYGEVCFPPRVQPKLVSREEVASCLRRQLSGSTDLSAAEATLVAEASTSKGIKSESLPFAECIDTQLLREEEGSCALNRRYFFLIRASSSTPCCAFWFEVSRPGEPDKFCEASSVSSRRRGWHPSSPLLIPGPFPRLLKVGCTKAGKRDSRAVHVKLLLKGAAAATEAESAAKTKVEESRVQASGHSVTSVGEGAHLLPSESTALPASVVSASVASKVGAKKTQFSGLMLGATRRTHHRARRASDSSSEGSSGASSEGS